MVNRVITKHFAMSFWFSTFSPLASATEVDGILGNPSLIVCKFIAITNTVFVIEWAAMVSEKTDTGRNLLVLINSIGWNL